MSYKEPQCTWTNKKISQQKNVPYKNIKFIHRKPKEKIITLLAAGGKLRCQHQEK